jgi:hypothetical protein
VGWRRAKGLKPVNFMLKIEKMVKLINFYQRHVVRAWVYGWVGAWVRALMCVCARARLHVCVDAIQFFFMWISK